MTNSAHNITYDGKIGSITANSSSGSLNNGVGNTSGSVRGSLTYQIDMSYTIAVPTGYDFIPTHVYDVRVAFADIVPVVSQTGAVSCSFSGIDSSIHVGSASAFLGESWSGSIGGDGLTGRKVNIFIKSSYVCTVPADGCDFTFGFSTSNIALVGYDYGVTSSDSVVGAINQGTASQDKGNDLQKEQNDLQKEQNDTTKSIFDKISDFFAGFFDGIINALKSVFVPEDGYFQDFFERLNDFFAEKLGALYTPIDLFVRLLQAIQNASAGSAGIPFPGIEWDGTYIIESQTVNLQSIADDFDGLQDKIYFVTDVIMVGAVIWLLQSKLREVLKG